MKFLLFSTHEMKYFLYLPKKKYIFFLFIYSFFFSLRGNFYFFPSHFSLISLGSARSVGILGANQVCTYWVAPRKWFLMSF